MNHQDPQPNDQIPPPIYFLRRTILANLTFAVKPKADLLTFSKASYVLRLMAPAHSNELRLILSFLGETTVTLIVDDLIPFDSVELRDEVEEVSTTAECFPVVVEDFDSRELEEESMRIE